jgi:prophage maintenance system killer protein
MSNTTVDQAQVQELLGIVKAQKAEISNAEKPNWETNCTFGYNKETSNRSNIRTITDVNELTNMLAFLLGKEKDFTEANNRLGGGATFDWLGYSVKKWESDLKTRVSQIQLAKRKQTLEQTEARLDKKVSQTVKDEQDLAIIAKLLKGDND